jgi:membrane-bound lytic murein transglycosylase B
MRRRIVFALTCVLAVTLVVRPRAAQDENRPSFQQWLVDLRSEALSKGIRQEIVDEALGNLSEPLPVVIERDRAQAEIVLPLETYISRRLTARTVRTGRQMLTRHAKLLNQVAEKYGVPSSVITAIWGVESNYGRFSGVRPIVAALATLAWDARRSAFFRGELFNALEILNRGDIDADKMRGSWAGAMGQPQFMPSSYLRYAEDFDGDGLRNIWDSPSDIFASVANYLKAHGWVTGKRWGREVKVPVETARRIGGEIPRREGTCSATRDMSVALPLEEWQKLGVRLLNGRSLPAADQNASLVSGAKRHFLVYENYDALLEYNCAHAYALSVAMLADRIAS